MSAGTSWHRGKEVTAEDLLRTEAHLFARFEFQQQEPAGVESFRLDGSVLFQVQADGSLVLAATAFTGVTDRGHLVEVGEEEYLELPLPASVIGETFELSVRCNPDWGEPPTGDPLPKLVLSARSDDPPAFGGRLGLGEWKVTREGELELVSLPLPRRLGALQPHDSWWEQWVSPLRKALAEHLSLGRIGADADWRQLLWIDEVAALASGWVHMPVPMLAGRCHFIRWLAEGATDLEAGTAHAPHGPCCPTPNGQALPQALASLLGQPLRAAAPPAPRPRQSDPLPTSLPVALRFLTPETLLARFPAEGAPDGMALCLPLRCKPPARLQVRGGAGPQGFRVAGEIHGEPRATVMVYRLPTPPAPGETWRFSPLEAATAEAAYLSG